MEDELYRVYLDGDPDTDSTRRHMERVLGGEPRRRWPWLLGLLAGGTALAFWRVRRARREPRVSGDRFEFSGAKAPTPRIGLSRATGR